MLELSSTLYIFVYVCVEVIFAYNSVKTYKRNLLCMCMKMHALFGKLRLPPGYMRRDV